MYGYPKIISTRHDVEYLVSYLGTHWATDENKQRGLSFLQGLRDNTKYYAFDRLLSEGEEPDGEMPEFIVLSGEDGERRQERLTEDPSAMIFRLGLTAAEVGQFIDIVEKN